MTEDNITLPPEDDSEAGGQLPEAPAVVPAKPRGGKGKGKAEVAAAEPEAEFIPAGREARVKITPAGREARVKIILEENDNIPPTGLFVGINGRPFLIRPGEEVMVPESVVNVLNDAVEDIPRVDGSNNVVDYRRKMRFPYRLLSK